MGYHSSPIVTLLLTLFNARLGSWLGNPRYDTRFNHSCPQNRVVVRREEVDRSSSASRCSSPAGSKPPPGNPRSAENQTPAIGENPIGPGGGPKPPTEGA